MIEQKRFVCTDALNNNNKFWEYSFDDQAETVTVKYGRVGKTSTTEGPKPMTRKELDSHIKSKLKGSKKEGEVGYKPPYREIVIVAEAIMPTGPTGPVDKQVIREAAKAQLAKSSPELTKLVERLVEANKHELHKATGGQMNIDVTTGIISTPVGVVTKDSVNSARQILDALGSYVSKQDFDNKGFITSLNDYLMLVPQTVGHSKGWHHYFLPDDKSLQRQNTLLDQLAASADLAEARKKAALTGAVQASLASTPDIFDAELQIVTDPKEIARIEKMYFESVNNKHETRHLKPKRIYSVLLPKAKAAWDADGAKLKNHMQLWHGTRTFNVLSILKNSLFCPPKGGSFHVTGRMFGDGIYGSDQSTKALNYAYGYWDGGARDKNCFMFLVDFAMGESYVPRSSYETLPHKGYDSTFAKPGHSGIMNNEMIVYRNSQVNPRFLVEFG